MNREERELHREDARSSYEVLGEDKSRAAVTPAPKPPAPAPAPAPAPVSHTSILDRLYTKHGPLPLWGWGVGVALLSFGGYYYLNRNRF